MLLDLSEFQEISVDQATATVQPPSELRRSVQSLSARQSCLMGPISSLHL
jgi:hypothetical protein